MEVNTIDSFQGQERDIIVMSCVRTGGIGFLSDTQRLNVALTRARRSLLLCGNFTSLQVSTYYSLLHYVTQDATHTALVMNLCHFMSQWWCWRFKDSVICHVACVVRDILKYWGTFIIYCSWTARLCQWRHYNHMKCQNYTASLSLRFWILSEDCLVHVCVAACTFCPTKMKWP